ncbi:MAG TPA: hypothetical protein VH143_10110 [Kofleriaceae bacterium]|jgi:hypothetical protein|nr:hypothetical protein [Kofleriaceae bacterium]
MQTNHDLETIDISLDDLDAVVGGITAAQWNDVKSQAAPYCPNTVKQYAGVNPAKLSRGTAQKMANSCIAEMPFYDRGVAQGQFNSALNQYFSKK